MNRKRVLRIPESELQEKFILASGPGGQNVNKVSSAVQLRFDAIASPSLTGWQKRQLRRLASHLMNTNGEIVVEVSQYRAQARNRQEARARLAELIDAASQPPPAPRKKTKPTRASIERRLQKKEGRARTKRLRGRVDNE